MTLGVDPSEPETGPGASSVAAPRVVVREPVPFRQGAAALGVSRIGSRAAAVTAIVLVIGLATVALTLLDGGGEPERKTRVEASPMRIEEGSPIDDPASQAAAGELDRDGDRTIDEALAAERALQARLDEMVPADDEVETRSSRVHAEPMVERDDAGPDASMSPAPDLPDVEARKGAARLLARSMRALDAGHLQLAAETGALAWEKNPTDARLASHLGAVHIERNDAQAAERWCRLAISIDPGLARAWSNLGAALLADQRGEEAGEAYSRALELAPGDWKALWGLASAQHATGATDDALATLDVAIEGAPHRAELWYTAALLHEHRHDLAAARECFGRYLELSRGADPTRESKVREWLARHGAQAR